MALNTTLSGYVVPDSTLSYSITLEQAGLLILDFLSAGSYANWRLSGDSGTVFSSPMRGDQGFVLAAGSYLLSITNSDTGRYGWT